MKESWWNEVKDSLFDYLDCECEEYSRLLCTEYFVVNTEFAEDCLIDLISINIVMVSKKDYNEKMGSGSGGDTWSMCGPHGF
ncbi:hypothetical protein H5410_004411 [Solanum commersonii]|uniref:Uncharacterized protein n=1 Tax=Solanum commersonii TaxID=4109 RepID=A0A9J6B7M2_SOLCO|nr:hypothetical protein H5410_004411 [Solanum commersonii]